MPFVTRLTRLYSIVFIATALLAVGCDDPASQAKPEPATGSQTDVTKPQPTTATAIADPTTSPIPTTQSGLTQDDRISDETLRRFVATSMLIQSLQQQMRRVVKSSDAEYDLAARKAETERLSARMNNVVKRSGLTVEQLSRIGQKVKNDPDLYARAQALAASFNNAATETPPLPE